MLIPAAITPAIPDDQGANSYWSRTGMHAPAARRWLRRGLWLALLCFVLGTLAHSGHVHVPEKSSPTTHEQCDLCVGFSNTMSPPAMDTALLAPTAAAAVIVELAPVALSRRLAGLAQARAPPHSC